jgi:hypothetical protein
MLRMWVDEFIKQQVLRRREEEEKEPEETEPVSPPVSPPTSVKDIADAIEMTTALKKQPVVITTPTAVTKPAVPITRSVTMTSAATTAQPQTTVIVTVATAPPPKSDTANGSGKWVDPEALTFAEMEQQAILRQKQVAADALTAMQQAATTTAAPRAVVLPQRAGTAAPQLLLSLTPIVPATAAGGATSQMIPVAIAPANGQTVAITPLAIASQPNSSGLVAGGQFLSIAPQAAVASLVDASGRPAISGGLQTVTVSTPSGQISLTKVPVVAT